MSENNFGKLDLSSGSAQTPDILADQAPPSYTVHEVGGIRPPPILERTSAFSIHNHNDSGVVGLKSTYYATPGSQNPEQASTSQAFSTNSPLATSSPIISPTSSKSFSRIDTPLQFTRPPPPGLPYTSFEPIFIVAKGETLDKGFHHAPPPSDSKIHPFVTHDITEADWLRYISPLFGLFFRFTAVLVFWRR